MSMRQDILETIREIETASAKEVYECLEDSYTRGQIGNNTYQLRQEGFLELSESRCYSLTPKAVQYLDEFDEDASDTDKKAEPTRTDQPTAVTQKAAEKVNGEHPATQLNTEEKSKPEAEPIPTVEPGPPAKTAAWPEPPDLVNHPPHYTHPSGIECIQITEHMNFNLGNAIKYLWRADSKGNQVQDLQKARWYIDREIQRIDRESASCPR